MKTATVLVFFFFLVFSIVLKDSFTSPNRISLAVCMLGSENGRFAFVHQIFL